MDMGELIEPGDDEEEDIETDPERRRLQVAAAEASAFSRAPYYRPPLVTTAGGCAGTAFGCCTIVTAAGVVNPNIARINRFGDNCPRRAGFLDTCARQRFGCCSARTGFNVACANRLCTNDILRRPPIAASAVATATATATARARAPAAAAVATAVARPVVRTAVPRVVATPYVAPRTTAVATATAAARGGVITRPVGFGYRGPPTRVLWLCLVSSYQVAKVCAANGIPYRHDKP